jgi:hypothetical protein
MMMRKEIAAALLVLMCALPATAGPKQKGTAKLDDLQTTGTTDKKDKNQRYDFVFETSGNKYMCRTAQNTKLKATDFVVGNDVRYEIDSDKVTLKSMAGKETKCKVVRVEAVGAAQAPAAAPTPK